MRKAEVYLFGKLAGFIEEKEPRGYRFWYASEYLAKPDSIPLSPLMSLTSETVESEALPAFFDGLIPEGWLLDIAEKTWKLNLRDRFGCLLACCRDCIGAASIREAFDRSFLSDGFKSRCRALVHERLDLFRVPGSTS